MKDIRNYLDKLAVKLASKGLDDLAFDVWSAGTSVMKYSSSTDFEEAKDRYFSDRKIDETIKYINSGQMDRDIQTMVRGGMSEKEIANKKFEDIRTKYDGRHGPAAKEYAETLYKQHQRGAVRAASLILSKMACHLKSLGYEDEAIVLHSSFAKIASKGRAPNDTKEHFQVMSLEEMYENTTHKAEQKPILENIQIMVKTYESVLRLIKKFKNEYEKLTKAYLNNTGKEVSDSEVDKFSNKIIELITYYDSQINEEFRALAKAMA